jgi:hypothetical protein
MSEESVCIESSAIVGSLLVACGWIALRNPSFSAKLIALLTSDHEQHIERVNSFKRDGGTSPKASTPRPRREVHEAAMEELQEPHGVP